MFLQIINDEEACPDMGRKIIIMLHRNERWLIELGSIAAILDDARDGLWICMPPGRRLNRECFD